MARAAAGAEPPAVMALSAPAVWSAWNSVTPVLARVAHASLASARIPMRIAPDRDGGYPDLRVIDERGTEIPYAIDPEPAATDARDIESIVSNFVVRRGTVALVDLGRHAKPVDTLTFSTDVEQRPAYFEHVVVDASDDRRRWRTLGDDAIVFRISEDDSNGNQTVSFPATHARWLRLRVLDPHEALPLTSASVERIGTMLPALRRLPIAGAAGGDAVSHRQIWRFDAPVALRPCAVAFEDVESTFARPVRIESSDDGKSWAFAGDGTIAHYADGTKQTAFAFSPDTARHWRVVVENGDDAPLTAAHPVLLAMQRELVFGVAPERTYRLLSGNPDAAAPSYDLGQRLSHARWSTIPVSLGATVRNDAYRDARPLLARHPWLLAVLVAAGTLVVLTLAVFMRRERERSAPVA